MLYIYDYLLAIIKKHLEQINVQATIDYYIGRAWHAYRYIQVLPKGWESPIHYEYREGHWELHFENSQKNVEVDKKRRNLISKLVDNEKLGWGRWEGRHRGLLRHAEQVEDEETFRRVFTELYEATAGLLNRDDATQVTTAIKVVSKTFHEDLETDKEEYLPPNPPILQPVSQIRFDLLEIPHYQRPYKWTIKNVNQLINDILSFKKNNEYRLGTLILYGPVTKQGIAPLEVVDGQQRIVTLALLLGLLMRENKFVNLFSDELIKTISTFLKKACFYGPTTYENMSANIQAIYLRLHEFNEKIIKFLLENCKFVVIVLHDISEAFQFFDSQNSRGKELLPHDLLKAFHLRSISNRDDKDRDNISTWENYESEKLEFLFLMLFRVKAWIKTNEGRFFTSAHIGEFKGLDESLVGLPYQKIYTIAQCYTEQYNQDPARRIDRQKLNYPHQIDQVVINGSLFFDMIKFYRERLDTLNNVQKQVNPDVMEAIESFKDGTGNRYTRFLFDSACLFYWDKFGEEKFAQVMEKIFAWAYGKRLTAYAIKLATVDNLARGKDGYGFFSMLHNSVTPDDVLNWLVTPINKNDIAENQVANKLALDLLEKLHYVC